MNVTIAPSFVPNPPGRGTLGLLWECLFAYFLCLWTAIHVDACGDWEDKFGWCLLTFFLPEVTLFVATTAYFTAREVREGANEGIRDARQPAPTGLEGSEISVDLALLNPSSMSPQETQHASSCPVSQKIVGPGARWGLTHGYLVEMGALQFKLHQTGQKFLDPDGIRRLAKCNMLPTVRFLNRKIKALQKSDKLAKTLVCIQVSWLVIQAIARRIEMLPVTLLELNTIAQVWITLVLYGVWWYKPQGIAEAIEIDFSQCAQCQKQLDANGITPFVLSDRLSILPKELGSPLSLGFIQIVIAVYITIDALGWTAYFPTDAERILWHVSIGMLAVAVTVFLLLVLILRVYKIDTPHVALFVVLFFEMIGRTLLTIEAFISIRSLPIGAYSTPSLSDFLPHIG